MSNPFEEFKKQFREDDPVVRFERERAKKFNDMKKKYQEKYGPRYHFHMDESGNVHRFSPDDFTSTRSSWWDDTKAEYNIYECSSNLEPIVGAAKYTGYANQKRLEGEVVSVKRVEGISL